LDLDLNASRLNADKNDNITKSINWLSKNNMLKIILVGLFILIAVGSIFFIQHEVKSTTRA
tara:strand:+ start:485 stop:667 length:183 start_codon:yes stop_codon:yes gene_type:complete